MRITNLTLLIAFFLFLSLPICSTTNIEARVSELLSFAMHETENNNYLQAELLYLQAKSLHSSLPRPRWLKTPPRNSILDEQRAYLGAIASMPWAQSKPLLDERLAREPSNTSLRKKYLELAEKHQDRRAVQRHRSALNIGKDLFDLLWRIVLLIILGLLILWNLYAAIRDHKS